MRFETFLKHLLIGRVVALSLLAVLLLYVAMVTAACGPKKITTPPEAAAVGADLSGIVAKATETVLAQYKAGNVPATFADPFMSAIDTKVLPLSRRARTGVAAWRAATEGPLKVQSGEELKAILADLEREAKAVFGVALPPAVSISIGSIAADLYDAIGKIRALIAQARAELIEQRKRSLQAAMDLYRGLQAADIIGDAEAGTSGGRFLLAPKTNLVAVEN